jgi:thioredoxin reductase (NADPH)
MTINADVVIVGAGPSGLFQVCELGLLGLSAHVVDSLANIGGQCTALYPEKPIYDIPALPVCNAQELVERLSVQIEPFNPTFHLNQEVVELQTRSATHFYLRTSGGVEFLTRSVVIAGGLGSFQPRPLRLPDIERHAGASLHYKVVDRERFRDRRLVILGGGASALDWTLDLRDIVRHITLIHRREEFRGAPASVQKVKLLANDPRSGIDIRIAKVKRVVDTPETLTGVELEDDSGTRQVVLDDLLVFYGLSPKLGPIGDWGLGVQRRQIEVNPASFETNIAGVYAIGDINTYPGKKKLILSGFHEAALASFAIRSRLFPEEPVRLQYTTTSTRLHERLGLREAG